MIRSEIIPVIHVVNINQVITNVKTCLDCGLNKVFLINHVTNSNHLIECYNDIRKLYPNLWIGLNFLDLDITKSIQLDINCNALWCDQGISFEQKELRKFKGKLFSGLAFKYQPQPKDIIEATITSMNTCDVPTTSGSGTGKETSLEKVKQIRSILVDYPMAIASGVNENNILNYKGIVNCILVASSITSKSEIIDKDKLMSLINKLNE